MATARDALDPILAEIRKAAALDRRTARRRRAADYRRDGRILLYWCFPPSREAVTAALVGPNDLEATRRLCRALWRDLQAAKALPRYLGGRPARIDSLRLLFTCECAVLLRQRRAARRVQDEIPPVAPDRPLTAGEWLTGLCRAVEGGRARPSGNHIVRVKSLGRRPAR